MVRRGQSSSSGVEGLELLLCFFEDVVGFVVRREYSWFCCLCIVESVLLSMVDG